MDTKNILLFWQFYGKIVLNISAEQIIIILIQFSASALSFLATLDGRLTGTSGDLREKSYLFQRLTVIVQHFSSVLIHESFVSADEEPDLRPFQLLILASRF